MNTSYINKPVTAGDDITIHIGELLRRGYLLLQGYEAELQFLGAPGSKIAKEFIADGVGAIAADLLGLRKARRHGKNVTKAFFEARTSQAKQQIIDRYYQEYLGWQRSVVALLGKVSVRKPRLTSPGNSRGLLTRANGTDRFKKLDTKVGHVLRLLEGLRVQDLVWNSSLPKELPKGPKKSRAGSREVLYNIENLLRHCIERELSKLSNGWWAELIPLEIRTRAESRMSRREVAWPWYSTTSQKPVDFLDFADYKKIILEDKNWTNTFKLVFGSQSFIDSKLRELEPIRNDIGHSRPIDGTARDKLQLYFKDLSTCIDRHGIGNGK